MEHFGSLEIRVSGTRRNAPLSPENYDIREIAAMFDCVEDILYPEKTKQRPVITFSLEEGSAKNIFRTTLQAVVVASALLAKVQSSGSLDVLSDMKMIHALEQIQEEARRNNLTFEFSSSESEGPLLTMSATTDFHRAQDIWVDAEVYFYGTLNDAGGKEHSNIHLDTKEFGQVKIAASREFLREIDFNPLYKEFGVRALGKQNMQTGEIDRSQLQVIDIVPYSPCFDEQYIRDLIAKASPDWEGVSIENYMREVRGYE